MRWQNEHGVMRTLTRMSMRMILMGLLLTLCARVENIYFVASNNAELGELIDFRARWNIPNNRPLVHPLSKLSRRRPHSMNHSRLMPPFQICNSIQFPSLISPSKDCGGACRSWCSGPVRKG
ncbi:hypothetical protein EJ05DRAFT_195285 [Pseudovirgaria hyperparasitica]|uniref:Uncharacterized protein n=1 Tax=Pseudovirgaria hyperparasitica TaxID=470096 RepID=A0A6A6WIX4_9PEZI|nr:uncharacterized protein EJ05DRAFT_195285 [Pseudovirgaria hyperparasitica]KAF2762056.1 hypothetical protein EJ05DRAFT_195285 [Pseudovirgaria hyperparasitica]